MKVSKTTPTGQPVPEEAEAFGQRMARLRAERAAAATPRLSLSCIYAMRPGGRRRELLMQWLRTPCESGGLPTGIPVNCKYQPNTIDSDLQMLLKRGLLVRDRHGGGGRRHPKNRTSRKRQTYLVLAS